MLNWAAFVNGQKLRRSNEMSSKRLSDEKCIAALTALATHGTTTAASRAANLSRTTFQCRVYEARRRGLQADKLAIGTQVPTGKLPTRGVYVITCAQDDTPVHAGFMASLKQYCKLRNALLVVVPYTYQQAYAASKPPQTVSSWASELAPYLYAGRADLNDNLQLLADVRVLPTATRPLASFEPLSGPKSCIVGHPSVALCSVATPHSRLPKLLSTTGAITRERYTNTRAGKIGEFHHVFGAVVVEVQSRKIFHLRQINAEGSGAFIDLSWYATPTGVKRAPRAAAVVLGDQHVAVADKQVLSATFGAGGVLDTLAPRHVVWHDVLDFYAANHHHRRDPFLQLAKRRASRDVVEAEVRQACSFLEKYAPRNAVNVLVASNHDEAFDRWLKETDWRQDMVNAGFYLETAMAVSRSASMTPYRSSYISPFHYWLRRLLSAKLKSRLRLLERDGSCIVKGIEVGMHGDRGVNGSRGSLAGFRRCGRKTVIGHSHSPGINGGAYQVGTSSGLSLDYNAGLSSWLHCHCVIYANGKRSLIPIIDGSWRVPARGKCGKRGSREKK